MASTNALVEDKSSSCAVLAAEQLVRTLISITKIDNKATATDLLLASAELYDDSAESAAIVIVRTGYAVDATYTTSCAPPPMMEDLGLGSVAIARPASL